MASIEILRARHQSPTGEGMLRALAAAAKDAGDQVTETSKFKGASDWLVLFGVGADVNNRARKAQIARGARALLWDMGYMERKKVVGHLRMSINTDHPPQYLDQTSGDASRFDPLGIALREDHDPDGPILLIGLGRKSRAYLGQPNWEAKNYAALAARFPGRPIVYRPKGEDDLVLPCKKDGTTPIEDLLRGAALVVCRHSNVAVDAAIAGVPFEAEDGAAMWLQQREFTPENRLEFLRRLAWWQWKSTEAAQAWAFAKGITCA
jgi:hypothetical protein